MKCQNDSCEFVGRCPHRPIEHKPGQGPGQGPGALPAVAPIKKPDFRNDENGIGHLDIHGPIGEATTAAMVEACQDLKRMRGLLVHFDTDGGNALHQDVISGFLSCLSDQMPVVGVVRRAYSAGMTCMVACGKVFAEDEDAEFGCFGSIAMFCNGRKPQILCSAMAPNKLPDRKHMLGPSEFCSYTEAEVRTQQVELDRRHEKDLNAISAARGVPAEVLAEILDGTRFKTQGAKFYDLVDGVMGRNGAYKQLITN